MKILVTGVAGFIGYHVASRLLGRGDSVVGLDNLNDYYPREMKYARLSRLGIADAADIADEGEPGCGSFPAPSRFCGKFRFYKCDLSDRQALPGIFARERFDAVVNLAAQTGAGHSVTHPFDYMESNVVGFVNLLECCRNYGVGRLVNAGSGIDDVVETVVRALDNAPEVAFCSGEVPHRIFDAGSSDDNQLK